MLLLLLLLLLCYAQESLGYESNNPMDPNIFENSLPKVVTGISLNLLDSLNLL